jgi:hypothetical protein
MHITFVLELVTWCCLLHNLLIHHNEIDVEYIINVLQEEVVVTQDFSCLGQCYSNWNRKFFGEQQWAKLEIYLRRLRNMAWTKNLGHTMPLNL